MTSRCLLVASQGGASGDEPGHARYLVGRHDGAIDASTYSSVTAPQDDDSGRHHRRRHATTRSAAVRHCQLSDIR